MAYTTKCLDSQMRRFSTTERVELLPCHYEGGNQVNAFSLLLFYLKKLLLFNSISVEALLVIVELLLN